MNDLIVLDRDGVINVDLMTYVTRPEDFEPIEGSLEAIALLNKKGFKIAIGLSMPIAHPHNGINKSSLFNRVLRGWNRYCIENVSH